MLENQSPISWDAEPNEPVEVDTDDQFFAIWNTTAPDAVTCMAMYIVGCLNLYAFFPNQILLHDGSQIQTIVENAIRTALPAIDFAELTQLRKGE